MLEWIRRPTWSTHFNFLTTLTEIIFPFISMDINLHKIIFTKHILFRIIPTSFPSASASTPLSLSPSASFPKTTPSDSPSASASTQLSFPASTSSPKTTLISSPSTSASTQLSLPSFT
ncbi:hypothetical protein V8G54_019244, partial [Vigna mungo]